MRQINPYAKAWANAERTNLKREKWEAGKLRRIKKGSEFLNAHHRYERTFSDRGTGEIKVMEGRDAKALNDSLFKEFLLAVDKKVEGRSLERWKVIERFVDIEKNDDA